LPIVAGTSGTLTVARGGTGATTAANARTALELGTAATADVSTVGGANKLPKFDSVGDWTTGAFANDGLLLNPGGNIYIPDMRGIQFLRKDGTLSGQKIFGWDEHGGARATPEMILESPTRIALIPYGGMQYGPNDPGRFPRYIQMVSGGARGTPSGMDKMPSGSFLFQTSVWNGSASVASFIGMQAHALDTTNANSVLRFYDQSDVYNVGDSNTAGRGDLTGTVMAEVYKDGIWSPGTAPTFATLTDGATITQTASKYKTVQAAKVTLAGNRTLVISGALNGMRGVIYVTQDATGSRTLTLSGGTALGLSTTAGYTDRVAWEFDGIYYNFSVTVNVQREVILTDSDAVAFITAASISSAPQKAAINTLVESLKAASLWTKFYAIYPFVGGSATAHAQDLKATYDITWAGDPTHNANGVTGDATDARGDTGINLFSLGATNSVSGYVYSKTQTPTDGGYFFGVNTATTRFALARAGGNLGFHGPNSQTNSAWAEAASDFRKHFAINRSSSTSRQLYAGAVVSSATESVVSAPDGQLRLLCRESVGSPANYTNANLAFAAFGSSLTEAEWTAFRAIIDTFQTALGRANA
jgi:hypothetical protein